MASVTVTLAKDTLVDVVGIGIAVVSVVLLVRYRVSTSILIVAGGVVGLLMIDVDHFKAYNDGYGHVAGDACLQQVSALLAYLLAGTSARLARYGGEEFAVILPGADVPGAAAIAERLRAAIEARAFEHRYAEAGEVTISIGVAAVRGGQHIDAEALVTEADGALYAAKHAGRNRVRLATVEAYAAALRHAAH